MERPVTLDPRTQQAVAELEATIRQHYPTAILDLSASPEDASSLHLTVIVNIDDLDDVGDLVLDRVLELNVTEGISIHVIPVRTPGRIARHFGVVKPPEQGLDARAERAAFENGVAEEVTSTDR